MNLYTLLAADCGAAVRAGKPFSSCNLKSASCIPIGVFARMDMTWVTDRIAVGGGIWTADKMAQVAKAGVTHIIDMQIEFDDTPLAEPHGIAVHWNPTDDDFQLKAPGVFQPAVEFALKALDGGNGNRLFIHCAAGVHRAPMMTLAILRALGFALPEAMEMIESRRPVVDFAAVYVRSVENFMRQYEPELKK